MSYSLKNVIKGGTAYTIGQFIAKAASFLLIPLYAHYIIPEEYGIVGYMQAITSIGVIALILGGTGIQNRYYYDYRETPQELNSLITSLNFFIGLFAFCICALFYFVGPFIFSTSFPYSPYFPLTFATLWLMVMNQLTMSFLIPQKRHMKYLSLQILQFALITIASVTTIIFLNRGARGQLEGLLIGHLVFFIFIYPSKLKETWGKIHKKWITTIFTFGVPLVLHGISGALLATVSRIIIERKLSLSELGIFTIAYQMGMALNLLTISINNAWQPNFYELMKKPDEKTKKRIHEFMAIWILIIGGICLTGSIFVNDIIKWIFPTNYQASAPLIPIFFFASLINGYYFIISGPIFYFKKTKMLPLITGSAALINILANWYLTPIWGIQAAAFIVLGSNIFMLSLTHLVAKRYFQGEYPWMKIALWTALITVPYFIIGNQDVSIYKILLGCAFITCFVSCVLIGDQGLRQKLLAYRSKRAR